MPGRLWFKTDVLSAQLIAKDSFKAEFFNNSRSVAKGPSRETIRLNDIVDPVLETKIADAKETKPLNIIMLDDVLGHTGELRYDFEKAVSPSNGSLKLFKPGDILYGRMRPYLNKCLFVDDSIGSGFCSPEFLVLRIKPRSPFDPRYVAVVLLSEQVVSRLVNFTTGSSRPRVQLQQLMEIEVPAAKLVDQRRIGEDFQTFRKARREQHERWRALVESFWNSVPLVE